MSISPFLDDSMTRSIPTVAQNDYIALFGWTDPVNNGVWQVVDATPIATQVEIERISGDTVITEAPSVVVDFDESRNAFTALRASSR